MYLKVFFSTGGYLIVKNQGIQLPPPPPHTHTHTQNDTYIQKNEVCVCWGGGDNQNAPSTTSIYQKICFTEVKA